jgi:regulatory protein
VEALGALARRDHASGELRRKLQDKGYDAGAVAEVLERLIAEKLLDDRRYVDNFVGSHAARGQGPLRVRAELRKLDPLGTLVDEALSAYPHWLAQARNARNKKFGAKPPDDRADKARQARFLGYRGFTSAQIRSALGFDIALNADDEGI